MTPRVRVPVLEILSGLRVVADPQSIDSCRWPEGSRVIRIARDDVFVLGADTLVLDDPHAIVEPESMFAGAWVDRTAVEDWMSSVADWHLPRGDGVFQGMVAALPVKILVEADQALVIVPVSFAAEMEARW
jgi:hypothetical protein